MKLGNRWKDIFKKEIQGIAGVRDKAEEEAKQKTRGNALREVAFGSFGKK